MIEFDSVTLGQAKSDSFVVTNTGSAALIISSANSSGASFSVAPDSVTIAPSASQTFNVGFMPGSPGSLASNFVLLHNAGSGHDTITAHGYGQLLALPSTLANGWNLVSLPMTVTNGRTQVAYHGSASSAFSYAGGYVQADSLIPGGGYWLKFSTARTDTISGIPVSSISIPVYARWNIIGSISSPLPVAAISSIPPGNIVSSYLGFDGAYAAADTLFPGSAYWVKATAPGTLTLSAANSKAALKTLPKPISQPAENQIVITDASGHTQTLSFGELQDGTAANSLSDLPPVPPVGAFDARFGTDRLIELFDKNMIATEELPIRIQAEKYPLKLEWNITSTKLHKYALAFAGQTKTMVLVKSGRLSMVNPASANLTLTISPAAVIPKTYSLAQNFPNPFNPSTTISYGLPVRSAVKLTVYNIIGQEVAQLIDGQQDAGFHSVTWQPNFSSGVYYYRIQAIDATSSVKAFTQIKKMMLIK
jgi:hypothetical protein